jgi:hypothetical protein
MNEIIKEGKIVNFLQLLFSEGQQKDLITKVCPRLTKK